MGAQFWETSGHPSTLTSFIITLAIARHPSPWLCCRAPWTFPLVAFPWQFFALCSSLYSGTLGKTRQKIAVQFLQCLNPVPVARCSSWYQLFISTENCVVYRFNLENQFKSFKKPLILLCSPALNTVMNNCNKCDYYFFSDKCYTNRAS